MKIKCKCGKKIKINYEYAATQCLKNIYYYYWKCSKCGQEFVEKKNDAIIINSHR